MSKDTRWEPCGHCDNEVPIGGCNNDVHVLPTNDDGFGGGHAYCNRKLELRDIGDTLWNGQKIFNTQFDTLQVTHCAECRQIVTTSMYWVDNDGERKHFECLSLARRKEVADKGYSKSN